CLDCITYLGLHFAFGDRLIDRPVPAMPLVPPEMEGKPVRMGAFLLYENAGQPVRVVGSFVRCVGLQRKLPGGRVFCLSEFAKALRGHGREGRLEIAMVIQEGIGRELCVRRFRLERLTIRGEAVKAIAAVPCGSVVAGATGVRLPPVGSVTTLMGRRPAGWF